MSGCSKEWLKEARSFVVVPEWPLQEIQEVGRKDEGGRVLLTLEVVVGMSVVTCWR